MPASARETGPADVAGRPSRLVAGSGRSLDAEGEGGEDRRASDSSPLRLAKGAVVDWPCSCGQGYRVLTEPLTFWARISQHGFRTMPTKACVACGADLEDMLALEAARLVSASILR